MSYHLEDFLIIQLSVLIDCLLQKNSNHCLLTILNRPLSDVNCFKALKNVLVDMSQVVFR